MNNQSKFFETIMSFCICTTGITLLEGVLGMLLYPDALLPYKAFFSPPLFALLSVALGFVNISSKELSVKQVLVRRLLHLILIEVMVFGLNYMEGHMFPLSDAVILAAGIAVVFVAVYVVLWLLDKRSAKHFNEQLKLYQQEAVKQFM